MTTGAVQSSGDAAGTRATRVDVVWARPGNLSRLRAILDRIERTRLASLRRDADRDRYVAAHALLRIVVARRWSIRPDEVPLDFTCARCGAPHGPPTLTAPPGRPPFGVSLSRAGTRVVVALSPGGAVGVDVEAVTGAGFPGFDEVALAVEERDAIGRLPSADQARARTVAWVRKEAVLKAAGCGLDRDPRRLVIEAGATRPYVRAWHDGPLSPGRLQVVDLDVGGGHVACVALVGDAPAHVLVESGDELLSQPV